MKGEETGCKALGALFERSLQMESFRMNLGWGVLPGGGNEEPAHSPMPLVPYPTGGHL